MIACAAGGDHAPPEDDGEYIGSNDDYYSEIDPGDGGGGGGGGGSAGGGPSPGHSGPRRPMLRAIPSNPVPAPGSEVDDGSLHPGMPGYDHWHHKLQTDMRARGMVPPHDPRWGLDRGTFWDEVGNGIEDTGPTSSSRSSPAG